MKKANSDMNIAIFMYLCDFSAEVIKKNMESMKIKSAIKMKTK